MAASVVELVERHWLALALASPVIVYASWIAALVVPEVLKAVVPTVVRAVTGS